MYRKKLLLKVGISGSFNSYLRGKFSKFNLAGYDVKAKLPQSLEISSNTIKGVKEIFVQV